MKNESIFSLKMVQNDLKMVKSALEMVEISSRVPNTAIDIQSYLISDIDSLLFQE